MNFEKTVAEIFAEFQPLGVLTGVQGDANAKIRKIASVEASGPGSLVFMDKKDYLTQLEARRPTAVVTTAKFVELLVGIQGLTILISPNVSLAHALIKKRYGARDFSASGWSGVHPSAVVHPTAEIGSGSTVEPGAVIGARVRVGRDSRIMAGAAIENDAVIGDQTVIHPRVVVGYGCRIGSECDLGPGTVVGSEGYGFAQDSKRKSYPIPQTGIVVIEDRVRVGANCAIDRATYAETRIGAGTKIDNLCHIAHNVQIGEDCLLTAFFCVAGSSVIGSRVIASGQTGILDHMKVCDDAVLLHRAGVTQDVEKPGAYAGLPLQPLGEYMKNTAIMRSAVELRKRVMDLEKKGNS
jgi:UDP-3-O-[3-hydroxymyristoyl] glucosamine N-acyltransferase